MFCRADESTADPAWILIAPVVAFLSIVSFPNIGTQYTPTSKTTRSSIAAIPTTTDITLVTIVLIIIIPSLAATFGRHCDNRRSRAFINLMLLFDPRYHQKPVKNKAQHPSHSTKSSFRRSVLLHHPVHPRTRRSRRSTYPGHRGVAKCEKLESKCGHESRIRRVFEVE